MEHLANILQIEVRQIASLFRIANRLEFLSQKYIQFKTSFM